MKLPLEKVRFDHSPHNVPLRLLRTLGILRGGDYLNQRFCELIYDKLKDEDLPNMPAIMQGISELFEGRKRSFTGLGDQEQVWPVLIPGLRPNPAKGIRKERLLVTL